MKNKLYNLFVGTSITLVTLQGCLSNNNPSHPSHPSDHGNHSHSNQQGAHSVVSSQQTKDQQFIQKLVELKQRYPIKDAQQALAKGTLQLIAKGGRGLNVPGVDASKYPQLKQKCGVRYQDDFADLLYGKHHRRYHSALHDYAEKYNKVILQACYQ
jgi:hypothetical protein